MSSPLHKFLFSPPLSPLGPDSVQPSDSFSPFPSILRSKERNAFVNRAMPSNLNAEGEQPAPATSTTKAGAKASILGVPRIDVEAANMVTTPYRAPLSSRLSPRYLVQNKLPRPILRMIAFVVFLIVGIVLLRSATETFMPAMTPGTVLERNYIPPQAAVVRQMPLVAPNPRTQRPHNHPLPRTHELLAVQSFVMESQYNQFRADMDPSQPIDASDVLGNAAGRLGGTGSAREHQWFQALISEHAHNVVLWYSTSIVPHYATQGVSSRHGHGNRPTLISTANREDAHIIHHIFQRLGFDLEAAPVLVIGGEPILATEEVIDDLRSSGTLAAKLVDIGWRS